MTGPALPVRLPNWIGDGLMALPTLERLSGACSLHLLGRPWAVELFEGHGWATAGVVRGLRAERDAQRALPGRDVLLLTHSLSTALAARWARRRAMGYRRDLRGLLLARSLPWPRGMHEARRYWGLGRLAAETLGLALDWAGDPPPAVLRLSRAQRDAAAAALAAAGVAGAFVAIAPLATGTVGGRPKQWPGFPALAGHLRAAGRTVVAVAPAGREAELASVLPGAVLLRALPTGVFAAVLAHAELVVANDSGPMHLAAAVGADTIGVFGVSDPQRTGAWGGRFRAFGGPAGWPEPQTVAAACG